MSDNRRKTSARQSERKVHDMPQNGNNYRSASNANSRATNNAAPYQQQNYSQNYPYYYPSNNAQQNPQQYPNQYKQNYYASQQYPNAYYQPQQESIKKSVVPKIAVAGVATVVVLAGIILLQGKQSSNPGGNINPSPTLYSAISTQIPNTQEAVSTAIPTTIPSKEVFAKETFVDGVDLGGLTFEEGKSKISQNTFNLRNSLNISVNFQGVTVFSVNAATVGFQINSDYTLNKAWSENKTRSFDSDSVEKSEYLSERTTMNYSTIDSMLEQVKNHAYIAAKDASVSGFNPDSDNVFSFEPEVYGREIDIKSAREEILDLLNNFSSGTVELKATQIAPKVLLADLKQRYKLLNRSRTPISKESTEQRIDNIRVAFSRFNGMTLKPGKRFSFNRIVGERTLEKGFFEAIEYAYGDLVYGYGGGVCQASTTVYLAALQSGLRIRKREQHSLPVNYTDMGLDATVYLTKDREIDFIFENNTKHDIFISAKVIRDPANRRRYMAEVAIYGYAQDNIRYELVTEQVEILPAPLNPVIVKDRQAQYVTYTDQEHVVSKAREGYVIDTYLLKYDGDTLVSRTKVSRDTYKARPERKYVGVTPRY